ncbi:hypothetical protein FKM82_013241 [Ascaphus truei]
MCIRRRVVILYLCSLTLFMKVKPVRTLMIPCGKVLCDLLLGGLRVPRRGGDLEGEEGRIGTCNEKKKNKKSRVWDEPDPALLPYGLDSCLAPVECATRPS